MVQIENKVTLPEWMWWQTGECVVQLISIGHFPSTVMVKLPSDTVCEVELSSLTIPRK